MNTKLLFFFGHKEEESQIENVFLLYEFINLNNFCLSFFKIWLNLHKRGSLDFYKYVGVLFHWSRLLEFFMAYLSELFKKYLFSAMMCHIKQLDFAVWKVMVSCPFSYLNFTTLLSNFPFLTSLGLWHCDLVKRLNSEMNNAWIWILALLLPSSLILGRLLKLCEIRLIK